MLRPKNGWCRSKQCGLLLMIVSLMLMMLIVPGWAWAGIVCTALLVIGFVMWRFC